jgi:hypothetical protein
MTSTKPFQSSRPRGGAGRPYRGSPNRGIDAVVPWNYTPPERPALVACQIPMRHPGRLEVAGHK